MSHRVILSFLQIVSFLFRDMRKFGNLFPPLWLQQDNRYALFSYGVLHSRYFCFPSSTLFFRLLFFLDKVSAYLCSEIPLNPSRKFVL